MLTITAIHMMINSLAEGALPWFHKLAGGTESYRAVTTTSILREESGGTVPPAA